MNGEPKPMANTDRELWREREGDYYADSIHVTEGGGIGINCGGTVHVRPLRGWHDSVSEVSRLQEELRAAESRIQSLTEAQRWIPVEERLPEQYASALIAHTESRDGSYFVEEAQWDGEKWMLVRSGPCDDMIWLKEQVTHWQPMPAPPEAHGKENK